MKEDSGIPNKNGMRTDVVEALKKMGISVLRCKTYVNGNVGSGTVQEMSEWVEYMTFDGISPMANLRKANGHEKPWKVDYFGVGNENWGCGGNMTPEYYGNLYRRYQTYVRQYNNSAPIAKICCGANADDTDWTENVLKTCFRKNDHGHMNGLSLHYYTVPHDWQHKGSATKFDQKDWYLTLKKTLFMEELIHMHGAIMDQFDPEKKIGMMIDEWGTWYDVEPGTNPGFLYQQNTMRDALVAALNLNIFNRHCDRVKLACIAQMVNVLQAVVLTEGEKILLTPTYHVFRMYKKHQGAQLLESCLADVCEIGTEEYKVPNLQESVSAGADGTITVTLANLSLTDSCPVEVILAEKKPASAKASILTGKMDAYNTFEKPDAVKEEDFDEVTLNDRGASFTIPACSVISLQLL